MERRINRRNTTTAVERRRRVVSMYSKTTGDDMDQLAWMKPPPERVVSMTSLKASSPASSHTNHNNNVIDALDSGHLLRRPSSMFFEYTKKQSFADLRSEKTRYMKQKARSYNKVGSPRTKQWRKPIFGLLIDSSKCIRFQHFLE